MATLTMIEHVGCHENHLAVFVDDQLQKLVLVSGAKKGFSAAKQTEVDAFKSAHPEGNVAILECSSYFQEFESLSDFPTSLQAYFKA